MPLDDREKNFERALRGHLQTACPDAETLAAYHERALASDEMILWKKHIANCAACQELLAQIENTEELVLNEERELAVAGMSRQLVAAVKPAALPSMRSTQRAPSWRWAAPAGAIAAGLLVWVFIRGMTPTKQVSTEPTTQIAENRVSPPPAADEVGKSREAVPNSAPSSNVQGAVSPKLKQIRPERRDYDSKDAVAPFAAAPAPVAPPQAALAEAAKEPDLDQGRSDKDLTAANQKKESSETKLGRSPQDQQASAAAPVQAQSAPRKTEQNQAAAAIGGRLAGGETAAEAKQEQPFQGLISKKLLPVVSNDGRYLWRFGDDGSISRSQDQGKHWQAQTSGVAAQIRAGSSPTDEVCWAVGSGGTILRTVDGGAHWTKVSSPTSSDLGAVQAADGDHARIWDLSRKLSYKTADGGATWHQVAGQ